MRPEALVSGEVSEVQGDPLVFRVLDRRRVKDASGGRVSKGESSKCSEFESLFLRALRLRRRLVGVKSRKRTVLGVGRL